MDVGADNFRFTLDDPEMKARTIRWPKTSELHLDSLDRYHDADLFGLTTFFGNNTSTQNIAKCVGNIYGNPANDNGTNNCTIQTKRNLLYGYMTRVALTQFNLSYKVPTVVTGYNDKLNVLVSNGGSVSYSLVTLPQGYYNVETLGNALQSVLNSITGLSTLTVTDPTTQAANPTAIASVIPVGYTIATNTSINIAFSLIGPGSGYTTAVTENIARTLRLIGANKASFGYTEAQIPTGPPIPGQGAVPPVPSALFRMGVPNFRPTDYVDIVSRSLTNYKDTKDGNSSEAAPQPIGRIWLTEYPLASQTTQYGWPQDGMWGMAPMTFTKTWANPNWSQWSPNQAIYSVDITLLDMWGNPLFWNSTYYTEWSATLSVTE